METSLLLGTVQKLFASAKGLLAMDESEGTCNKRLASIGLPGTEENRRAYREVLVTTPGLGESISGAILYDETLYQCTTEGRHFVQILAEAGILIGIKVDQGTQTLAGHPTEKVTEGLDGLRTRLKTYFAMGARFAKWRAVFSIAQGIPSRAAIEANALALARYAALCQESSLVPIVEPEVLMDGGHTRSRCQEVTEEVLHEVFRQLVVQGVMLEGMILKPNMVLAGSSSAEPDRVDQVASSTLHCLLRSVPAAVGGIAFLSGGQSGERASACLDAMHRPETGVATPLPWPVSFSFGRALQQPALEIWGGQAANRGSAQQALLHRARCNRAAVEGRYNLGMESG